MGAEVVDETSAAVRLLAERMRYTTNACAEREGCESLFAYCPCGSALLVLCARK